MNQVELMKIGGNKKLKEFLRFCGLDNNINKKVLYNSKVMNFYRKMVLNYLLFKQFFEILLFFLFTIEKIY